MTHKLKIQKQSTLIRSYSSVITVSLSQVEHSTYRAVIIDLGLARFQKYGFCFGTEGGNWCYSAPEIFQGKYRDQYSDVWAMGKILAELLIVPRARLPPNITSVQVIAAMNMNPYGVPVSRMVNRLVLFRPTMTQILGQIVLAGRMWILSLAF